MRCVSEDKEAATILGINVNHTILSTFAIGSGLAAVAALMYMAQYPKIYTTMGALLGLKAFIAAVLGGIGILPGAMLGGIVIGLVESFTTSYVSSSMAGHLRISDPHRGTDGKARRYSRKECGGKSMKKSTTAQGYLLNTIILAVLFIGMPGAYHRSWAQTALSSWCWPPACGSAATSLSWQRH